MKPGFDIETYKTRFLGGARQYLFFVVMVLPATDSTLSKSSGGGRDDDLGLLSGIKDRIRNATEPIVSKYNAISKFGTPVTNPLTGLGGQLQTSVGNAFSDITSKSIANMGQITGLRALNIFGLNRENDMIAYHVRSTTLPGMAFDEKVIDWSGLPFKMAGNVMFNDWTVSFNVDEGGTLLQKFNKWQSLIANSERGFRGSIRDYMIDQEVHLLSYSGDSVTSYKLYGCWPKSVGDVALDYSSQEIAVVDVTFSYQRYDVLPGPSPVVGDIIKRGFNRILGK